VARNRIQVKAPRPAVFAILADPERYPEWVLGAGEVRESDEGFPQPGTRFHHTVKLGLLQVRDHTEVIELEEPRRIVLRAKARPLGTAIVEIELEEHGEGTEVVISERPAGRFSRLLAGNPLAELGLRLRNAEGLSRLKRIAEGAPSPPPPSPDLRDRRVLVTGGSSGIGLASAEALASEGARVVLLARGEEGLAKAAGRLRDQGADVQTVAADVSDRESLTGAVVEATRGLGGLDLLVCAAAGLSFGRFVDVPPEDFDATLATVLGGGVDTIRAALPALERSGGAIVVVGSVAARMPLPTLSAYTAAKHGLAGFIDCLRLELDEAGSSVDVSLINPGAVDTPLWSHLESATGLLPPTPPGLYSAQAIAAAVLEASRRPRPERTVGGFAALQVAAFSTVRRPTEAALKSLARLALSAGDRRAEAGALHRPGGAGEVSGGFGARRSLAGAATAVVSRVRG
jgi:NAD(P)-dependent dehydrogenase (short-subunit alcohol dehydrogenase family)/uncharacterized protein YndB with AHSA1/START domain